MKRIAITIVCLMMISGCGPPLTENDLPPGYCIVRAVDSDVYSFRFPNGNLSANVWNTKEGAIKFAIHFDKIKKEPYHFDSDDHIWESCERRKDQ